MANTDISNNQDFIDSRDVIARIEGLERDLQDIHAQSFPTDHEYDPDTDNFTDWLQDAAQDDDNANGEEARELITLKELEEAASSSPDWAFGETLIRDSYFAEYAEEFASDIGAINRDAQWPLTHIDWEAAADDLKQDYMSVDYDGVEYWIRA